VPARVGTLATAESLAPDVPLAAGRA